MVARARPASEQSGLRVVTRVALLLPVCAFLVFASRCSYSHLIGELEGPSYRTSGQARVFVENYRDPASKWQVEHSLSGPLGERIAISVWYTVEVNSVYRNLFGLRPTLRYEYTSTIFDFYDAISSGGVKPIDRFEQEFGADWRSMQHPEFRARVLPVIEDAITETLVEAAREDALGPPVVTAGLANAGFQTVVSDRPADRWNVLPKFFSGTIPLWIALSVILTELNIVSRERKARRWVAMKCPKCGYERQRDRAECPECGLVYERPSYVLWDPTEDAAHENVRGDDT